MCVCIHARLEDVWGTSRLWPCVVSSWMSAHARTCKGACGISPARTHKVGSQRGAFKGTSAFMSLSQPFYHMQFVSARMACLRARGLCPLAQERWYACTHPMRYNRVNAHARGVCVHLRCANVHERIPFTGGMPRGAHRKNNRPMQVKSQLKAGGFCSLNSFFCDSYTIHV